MVEIEEVSDQIGNGSQYYQGYQIKISTRHLFWFINLTRSNILLASPSSTTSSQVISSGGAGVINTIRGRLGEITDTILISIYIAGTLTRERIIHQPIRTVIPGVNGNRSQYND